MTEKEATQLLRGAEALVRAGRGMCSQSTYDAICTALHPSQGFDQNYNLRFLGIELHVNPFVSDGVIQPWPREDVWGKPKFWKEQD